ncbi:ribosome hibernation-promoting factor, HPF/YfiA family [Angustibacter sp. Root456]|uniref:ribosome hibernation-promoting factor, HPF/YfiA family n=1 Tax=Angustibacter sp. Root456 TaxID=1736539 RepID=UPI0006FD11DC|nr:ribosome-associated translation inhibitor RaiA [Angustibacter sp. Root456]KQX69880.1 30S ribosomal protein S30 [Angustibacter sp. Root456]
MEIVVTGRHVEVKERFRRHLQEKLAKVPQLAPRIQRLDVVISHEPNKRQTDSCERVEITCIGKGPVVRAEAAADDAYAALDCAYAKLLERLRRAHDRKVVKRRRGAESLAQAAARLAPPADLSPEPEQEGEGPTSELDDSPVQIREKVHAAVPMTLEQALYEMELVGHDFYLFCDAESRRPSVVYRRRGWEYGVLHLDVDHSAVAGGPASSNGTSSSNGVHAAPTTAGDDYPAVAAG